QWPITNISGFAVGCINYLVAFNEAFVSYHIMLRPVVFFLRPLALVTWGSTLGMSHIELCEVRNWLTANMDRTREREMDMDGSYQDLLVRPLSVFFDKHDKKLCPKVCCQQCFMNTSKGSPEMNLNSPTEQSRNTSNDLGGSQAVPSPTSMQKESGASKTYKNSIAGKTTVEGPGTATTTQQEEMMPKLLVGLLSTTAPKPTAAIIKEKEQCSCKHEPTKEALAAAQKASGVGQIKASDVFIFSQQTEEAASAAACLTFLFVLLILSVLYTKLYKFHKS
ncbi:hypothetical protein XELAEV_18012121mg, partial [Xenopus laevis]